MKKIHYNFKNEVAVITGGGGGIGVKVAEALFLAGAKVAILDVDKQKAQEKAVSIDKSGSGVIGIKCDVVSLESIVESLNIVVKKFGKISLLVNSIGVNFRKPALDLNKEELQAMISVNFSGAFLVCKTAAEKMIEQNVEKAKMVNIASIGAWRGSVNYAVYNATKGGLVTLTKSLANEWIKKGIYVNTLCPGPTLTPFTKDYWDQDPKRIEGVKAHTPAGRICLPDDHVGPILFLLSDASDWIVGHALISDGGFSLD